MIAFIKKYKAFIIGLLLFRVIVVCLSYFEIIYIDSSEVLANTLSFIFGWLITSLPIHYFSFLKKHKTISVKLSLLIILFILVMANDNQSQIIDNPLTFVGLIVIALGFFSIITPSYFKKYALIIVGYYALTLSYFYYVRVYVNDLNYYLQQEKELKIILTVPLFVLLIGWAYQQWKWIKSVESKKAKAELALLKSQISPHFFFNTLNNLYGLTIEKSDDAPNVVLKLSDMMRYTIYMGQEEKVLLKDDITYLKNYIDLHKIRYHKSVDIRFKEDSNPNIKIAPLLLILPLENAFKHGVEHLAEEAYIHIDLKTDNGIIYFTIENNFDSSITTKKVGIGLDNLKQRLKLLYPNMHNLKIEVKENNYKLSLKIHTV
ncbi:sensor histidine kinase [Hanstruepera flava]|uniref:sensor histidine kinase n=1 Tax=Hanstruepera flava TaxID=2930218 RepID=UPI002028C5E9|nr:sensor histidine kinase [Hanstruepera flava]